MRPIQLSNDVVSVGELKVQAAGILRRVREERRPIVITQHGKPAGVLLSPEDFDEIAETLRLVESIRRGLADAESGRSVADHDLDLDTLLAAVEKGKQ